jgi:flavin-dependent dehydrogenase
MLRDLAVKAGASITYNTTVNRLSIPGSDRSTTGISTPSSTRSLESPSTEDLPDFCAHINEKGHVPKQERERIKPQVHLSSGHTLTADLVIGADGFHSVVRQYVWDQQGTDTNMSVLTCAPFISISEFNRQLTSDGMLPQVDDPSRVDEAR